MLSSLDLSKAVQELAGQPLQVGLPGVVERVAERPARQEEPRHLVVARDEGAGDHVRKVRVVGYLAHQHPLLGDLVRVALDRPDLDEPVLREGDLAVVHLRHELEVRELEAVL